MVQACSTDLRRRVVDAVLAGSSCRVAAARFGVAVSSAVKWTQLHRRTGSVEPARRGGRFGSVLDAHRDFILSRIEAESHVTVRRLRDELEARGVVVSRNAVWLFLRREGLTHKKKSCGRWSAGGPTSRGEGGAGRHGRAGSIPDALSSSMKLG